ncbi:MAG: acyl carrier protein [Bacteroidaceae bacterium]|nr:acyl carrier protein [Bacteroidaceae bacterium]
MELKDFIQQFAEQFDDTDASEIDAQTSFHDLEEWDSLIALAVLNMTEKRYGKRITFDDMKKCDTVEDLFNVILAK